MSKKWFVEEGKTSKIPCNRRCMRYLFSSPLPTYLRVKACAIGNMARKRSEFKIHQEFHCSTFPRRFSVGLSIISINKAMDILVFFSSPNDETWRIHGTSSKQRPSTGNVFTGIYGRLCVFRDQRYMLIVKRAVTPFDVSSLFPA